MGLELQTWGTTKDAIIAILYSLGFLFPFIVIIQVIAAITYQIVPADTQHAEIPLAAVSSIYQHKVLFFICFSHSMQFCGLSWFKVLLDVGSCSL